MLRTMVEQTGRNGATNTASALTTTRRNRAMADMPYKACTSCKLVKDLAEFSRSCQTKDGLYPTCKTCVNAARKFQRRLNLEESRAKRRAYVAANKERVYAINNKSRLRNQESVKAGKKAHHERVKNTPEFKQKQSAYTLANKDKKRDYDREYRQKNADKCKEISAAWVAANKDKRLAISRSYKARRRSQEDGGVTTRDLHAWTIEQRKVCYWCGVKCAKSFHVDHYTPLSRGGAHDIPNLVIACAPCNLKKNAKDPLDFARQVGRLL